VIPRIHDNKYTLVGSLTNDSLFADAHMKHSILPIIIKIQSVPPYLRAKFQFLTTIVKHTQETDEDKLIRQKWRSKNQSQQIEFLPLLDELVLVETNGYNIYDSLNKCEAKMNFICLFASADYRALPKINKQKSSPAIVGACAMCNIEGIYIKNLHTTYPGAIRY